MSVEISYRFRVLYGLNENWVHQAYLDVLNGNTRKLKEQIKQYAKDHNIQYDAISFECID